VPGGLGLDERAGGGHPQQEELTRAPDHLVGRQRRHGVVRHRGPPSSRLQGGSRDVAAPVTGFNARRAPTRQTPRRRCARAEGVLALTLPKIERAKPRQITVEVQKN
jgi:hypothetical protein